MKQNIAFLIFLVIGSFAQSQVLWYGDPDKSVNSSFKRFDAGNFPSDYCDNQSNNASSVGTVNDSQYGKVWRIQKPVGQKRGEFARTTGTVNSYTPSVNDLAYYGWRWKINSTPNINNDITVWQWKTTASNGGNTQNYPLNMEYGDGTLSFNAWGPCYPEWNSCGGSITNRKTTLWSTAVPENTWVSIVVGIKMSRNDNVGYVELWFNGEQQTFTNSGFKEYQADLSSDRKKAFHKTYDGDVMYPKWGSYNANSCDYSVNTFYDEMRVGLTSDDALPSGSGGSTPNNAPTVSISSPNTGTYEVGDDVSVTVNANDSDGNIVQHKVYVNNTLVDTDGSNYTPYIMENVQSGSYTVKIIVTDNDNATATATRTFIVNEPVGALSGSYRFRNVANGEYMDSDGTTIKTAVFNASQDRVWNIVESSNGFYNIDSNFANRGVLDTDGNKIVKGTSVQPVATADDKKWTIESLGNNTYRFKNAVAGRDYLAVNLTTKQIEYTTWNGSRSQWILEPVSTANAKNIDDSTALNRIALYPNPIVGSLLNVNGLHTDQSTLEVVDLNGRKITSLTSKANEVQLDVSALKAGFYILLVKSNTAHKSIPFIKE